MDTPTSKEMGANLSLDILVTVNHQAFESVSVLCLKIFSWSIFYITPGHPQPDLVTGSEASPVNQASPLAAGL
jgi:hypothetical protein